MAVSISLKDRLKQALLFMTASLMALIVLGALYFTSTYDRSSAEQTLRLKHKIVEQTLASYLVRAESEMSFIVQDLAVRNYDLSQALDLLFSHHDILFTGGLDFFYIDWKDDFHAMDPRARLFTQADFQPLLAEGQISRWVSVVTEDDATLLMYKKKILSSDMESLGFLYGFISLSDNLTLGNELLSSAQVMAVRLLEESNNRLLLEETSSDTNDPSVPMLSYAFPLDSAVQGAFRLEIEQAENLLSDSLRVALPWLLFVALSLLAFYWLLNIYIKKLLFVPLEKTIYQRESTLPLFDELQPIQEQSNHYRASIKAKDDQFNLLSESVHSAIIFSNEVAELQVLNTEAKEIFPEAERSRTVFDFLPISCHQIIQEALKGAVGRNFELTIDRLGRIYQWKVFSYHNEFGYRGILLVGRNVTLETSLKWQLDQLQPLSNAIEKKVDAQALQQELEYLTQLPSTIQTQQFQGWLSLTLSILEDIGRPEDMVREVVLGNELIAESAKVMTAMGVEANRALLDITLPVSLKIIEVDNKVAALLRLLFMMVMSNDMAERRLSIQMKGNELEFVAMHDMATRELFIWMIKTLASHLGAQYKILRNNALQFNLPVVCLEQDHTSMSSLEDQGTTGKLVAWIANDYPNSAFIHAALVRLGCKVKDFVSADSFFTQSTTIVKFDAILIGCDQDLEGQHKMTKALQVKHDRTNLPIVWVNSTPLQTPDEQVFHLFGCPFDYSLHQVLVQALQCDGIMPVYHPERGPSWIMVGGSRVTKAIWYSELEAQQITTQWLSDLSSFDLVLPYHSDAVIVLLEPQSSILLAQLHKRFPEARLFTIQDWQDKPDTVTLCKVSSPYSGEKIKQFVRRVVR